MSGYVINFAVYTMAMIGLIFFALMVYKKSVGIVGSNKSKRGKLEIEETMTIAPRKTLYVIRAGNERFLIASDADKTSLISKLADRDEIHPDTFTAVSENFEEDEPLIPEERFNELKKKSEKTSECATVGVDDLPIIVDFKDKKLNKQQSVIKNMLKKINE